MLQDERKKVKEKNCSVELSIPKPRSRMYYRRTRTARTSQCQFCCEVNSPISSRVSTSGMFMTLCTIAMIFDAPATGFKT